MYPQAYTGTYRCPVIAIRKAPKQIGLSWRVDPGRKILDCERREYEGSRQVELGFFGMTLDNPLVRLRWVFYRDNVFSFLCMWSNIREHVRRALNRPFIVRVE